MIPPKTIKSLDRILGKKNFLTVKNDLAPYYHDATNLEFSPDAVAFPKDAEEISSILKIANQELFPVIPRGAGSGMSGGAVALKGGLIMVMDRLNRILLIDQKNLIAKVEPGVITADLQREVEKCGLFYPPDPASLDVSTIGGNVAECAGGPRAVKYGVTRDYVLGLKVVLPTGEILNTGVETVKGVVGYDLTRLIVGSEGTLAVITEITLRLIPKPESKKTMLAVFPDIVTAADCVSHIVREKVVPTTLEFMDPLSVSLVRDKIDLKSSGDDTSLLLIELDGYEVQIKESEKRIRRICREVGAIDIHVAGNDTEAEVLWKARRNLSPSIKDLRPCKINQDVVVPRSRLADFIKGVSDIGKSHNLYIPCFGHAGDGNIHVNIMHYQDEAESANHALLKILKIVLGLNGTISGEHGIGITKKPYINMEISPVGLGLMARIKNAFDPNCILNPGKIFDVA